MFVKKLFIKNYRCFSETPAVIEFSVSGLTALIGPNNVGKSTVLKALEILLGDKWPTGQFNEDDFHDNNLNSTIVIACEFQQTIPVNIYGTSRQAKGIEIKATHIQTGYGESSVEVDYCIIETISDFDGANWQLMTSSYGNPVRISQDIKNDMPVVITVPLIKLHSEQPTNKWGVLGRMLQKVERVFASDKTRESNFQGKMREAVGILRQPQEFSDIENDIKVFWEAMKPYNLSGTTLEFLDYEPWHYYRQFKLSVKRNAREVPIETLGDGVQRLAIIALYRTYLKRHGRNERAILLVEEPESYLHPQARRTLFEILKQAVGETANVEGQIIYTTHSEDFIDCGNFDDIVIFSQKPNGDVGVRHIAENTLETHTLSLGFIEPPLSDQHIHYRLIETVTQGVKEALFAHKVVIVEGPSEIELVRFFTNADKEQIATVSAGGKRNIPSVYSFLTAFGIPCLVVIDRDERNVGENAKLITALIHSGVDINETEIAGIADGTLYRKGPVMVFARDLETVLQNRIINYEDLRRSLQDVFKIPPNSKPRTIQALGLAYKGIYNNSSTLQQMIEQSKLYLDGLSEEMDGFIQQHIDTPQLLT